MEQVANREKMMWPAVMLAARRKHKVTGRKNTLADSINTRGEVNHSGVPEGKNAAANFINRRREERIKVSHIGRPKGSVSARWDVGFGE